MNQLPQPLRRRPDESWRAHARLLAYAAIRPEHRTIAGCARQWGLSRQAVAEMAERHNWAERAAAWDRGPDPLAAAAEAAFPELFAQLKTLGAGKP